MAHIPDGVLSGPVLVAGGVLAAGGIALALRRLDEEEIPRTAILSAAFFAVSLFAVPSIIYIAHLKNMLDTPNVRTVHESLTPRLGGVAVFAGFMSALTIFADLGHGIQQLLAGCIVLFFVGLKDDLVSISVAKNGFRVPLASGAKNRALPPDTDVAAP